MNPDDFKTLVEQVRKEFIKVLDNCYTEFCEIELDQSIGQVFTLNVFYSEQYLEVGGKIIEDVDIVRPILHFQAKGSWKNSLLDINQFFSINNDLFNEFFELADRKFLNNLIPVLKQAPKKAKLKKVGQDIDVVLFFLTIESTVTGGNQFLRDLLEESIAIIGLDENEEETIEVSCSLNERKKITALIQSTPTNLNIPFDKIENFKMFEKENEHVNIDPKYIFVAMSFQKDHYLEDSYSAIKRSVKSLKKGLTCQRVDDIQDDFVINDKIIDCIKKCKVLIVDLTNNKPNVYYELGYARALGKYTILIAREGEKPHFDVSHQNIIFYNSTTSLEKSLKTRLLTVFKTL